MVFTYVFPNYWFYDGFIVSFRFEYASWKTLCKEKTPKHNLLGVNGVVCDGFMVVNRVFSRYYAMYRGGSSDLLFG